MLNAEEGLGNVGTWYICDNGISFISYARTHTASDRGGILRCSPAPTGTIGTGATHRGDATTLAHTESLLPCIANARHELFVAAFLLQHATVLHVPEREQKEEPLQRPEQCV